MQLYAITDEILNRYADIDGEEFDMAELEKWNVIFEDKIESCAAVVKNLSAEADACREEARRLTKKATVIGNRVDSLKDYIKRNLEYVGKRKVDAGVFTVRIQKSPMSVEIQDEALITDEYKWEFSEWRFDKKAIATAIKETGEIPDGVEVHQSEHLRIT